MKSHWMLVGLAAAGLGLAFVANSQEPAPKAFEKAAEGQEQTEEHDLMDADVGNPTQVQIQVEYVEMSHEALTKLLFLAKPKSSDATKLREQVQDMVSKNEAKVLETQIAITRSGQKATSEAIHEFIYPTEYEPPAFSGSFEGNPPKNPPVWSPGPTPTAYETRNLGSTLEIEPTIGGDNRVIDLRFIPELVWHVGNVAWHEGKDNLGNPFKVQMPDFYTIRLNTDLMTINGQYTLAGVVSPKNDKGDTDMTRKVMVFVKADIIVVK
jgi:hypothetical protein